MTRTVLEVAIARMQQASDALAANFSADNIVAFERAAAEAHAAFTEWRNACSERARKADLQRKERS